MTERLSIPCFLLTKTRFSARLTLVTFFPRDSNDPVRSLLLSCTVQETTNPTTHVRGNTEYVSVDPSTYYPDADGDGFGDPNGASVVATSVSTGYANNADDCNDENKRINPGQPEVCDLVDNNCDGSVDNAATDEHVWFIDGDGDGYGESSATTTNCDPYAPSRFSAVSTDCNDFRADMYPGAVEYCNDVDDNCDDVIDEDGAADGTVWYADADGDGRGSNADDAVTVVSCDKPKGYVNGHTDCDDTNAEVRTGAVELCDGVDNDCDGEVDNDASDGTAYYSGHGPRRLRRHVRLVRSVREVVRRRSRPATSTTALTVTTGGMR